MKAEFDTWNYLLLQVGRNGCGSERRKILILSQAGIKC